MGLSKGGKFENKTKQNILLYISMAELIEMYSLV